MADYQLTATDVAVIRTKDSARIPNDPANRDWVEYQEWLAAGGVPDPYVPPPEIDPGLPGGPVIPDEFDPEAQRANARLDAGVDAAQASVDSVVANLEAMPIEALQTQVLELAQAVRAILYAHDETPPAMIHATGKVAETVAKGLTSAGPLALPLVVINCLALFLVGYVLYHVADASQRRDVLITELAKSCQPIVEKLK